MDKRRQKVLGITDPVGFPADTDTQLPNIPDSMIGQTVKFKVPPKMVNGIEVGRIRRKPLQNKPLMRLNKLFHLATTMDTGTVTQHNNPPFDMTSHLFDETDSFPLLDILSRVESQIKPQSPAPRRNTDTTDSRNLLVTLGSVTIDRSLSFGRPGPAHRRQHKKARFVNKNKGGQQTPGFFLYGANPSLSSAERSFGFAPMLDLPVAGNSTALSPVDRGCSGDDRNAQTFVGLNERPVAQSINLWNNRAIALLLRVPLLTPPSVSLRVLMACLDVVGRKVLFCPSLGTFASNVARNEEKHPRFRRPGGSDSPVAVPRWHAISVFLILRLFRLVSCNIYRQYSIATLTI